MELGRSEQQERLRGRGAERDANAPGEEDERRAGERGEHEPHCDRTPGKLQSASGAAGRITEHLCMQARGEDTGRSGERDDRVARRRQHERPDKAARNRTRELDVVVLLV